MKKITNQRFKRNFLTLLMGLSSAVLFAQGTLSGTITDGSQNKLAGVYITLEGKPGGAISREDGTYSMSVPAGENMVIFSSMGYAQQKVALSVTNGGTYTKDITMAEDNLSLTEMVVTGTFNGRSQKESPMSVTLLDSRKLDRLSANSQADILRTIPGITAEGGGGEVASNVFVRGMPSGGQYQFTPLQVDGMPVLSTFGLNSSAHDVYFRNDVGIKNLEFVRGGLSTLFGAGSVAGIINYTSVTGTSIQKNKVQMEYANGGRMKTDFLTAGPLSENLFYAVSGFYRYDEGPLETGMASKGYQIRGNLKKVFNEGKSSFTVYGQVIDDNVQFYLPYPLNNDAANNERTRPEGNDGEPVYTMLTSQAAGYSFDTPFGRFKSPIGNGVTTNGGYAMAQLKHSFGNNWKLSSNVKAAQYDHWFNLFLDGDGKHNVPETQASYLTDRGGQAGTGTFSYVDNGQALAGSDLLFQNRILDRQRPMEELVGETQLTKKAGNHTISFGTFASNTRAQDNNWISNFVGDFSNSPRTVNVAFTDTNGVNQQYSTGGFISGAQTSNNSLESTKIAFYAGDEIKGEKFNIDFGVRWERAAGNLMLEKGVGSNNFNRGQVSASDVALAFAGLYKLNTNMNLYGNFSRGYFFPELRSVKFSAPGTPQSYETEGILQGEIGAKYARSKFSATAALFYVALNDRRSVDFINDPANPGQLLEQAQVQSTQTMGLETSLNYSVADGVNLYGNFTFQDHQFTEVESDPAQVGNKLRRQPNVMGMAGVSYDKRGFDANLSSNFMGKKFANDANTVELGGFNIVRLDAGYTFKISSDESMRLGLAVFNLLDTDGVTEGSPRQGNLQSGSSEFFVGRPILPRRVFLRLAFNF